MTALSDYAKLEAEAVFFEAHTGLTTDVILSFGERSLIIVGLDDRALAHWPLASLHSSDAKGSASVRIAPDRSAEDHVQLQDAEMIAAIQAVCPNLHNVPQPKPTKRRPRWVWLAAALGLLTIAGIASAPMLMSKMTDDIALDQEVRLGRAMRGHVIEALRQDGVLWTCTAPEGRQALDDVMARIGAETSAIASIAIIDLPEIAALSLPGGETLIFRGLIEATNTPEGFAGTLAHQIAHVKNRDALKVTVAALGPLDLVKLWWGAEPTEEIVEDAVEAYLAGSYTPQAETAADTGAIAMLQKAALPTRPFATDLASWRGQQRPAHSYTHRHPVGSDRIATIGAADGVGNQTFTPALDDRSWLALGNICDEREPFE